MTTANAITHCIRCGNVLVGFEQRGGTCDACLAQGYGAGHSDDPLTYDAWDERPTGNAAAEGVAEPTRPGAQPAPPDAPHREGDPAMARTETAAQRNRRLLAQALRAGLVARPTSDAGVYGVSSASTPGVVYRVSAGSCGCEWARQVAATGGRLIERPCSHLLVAAAMHRLSGRTPGGPAAGRATKEAAAAAAA